MSKVTRLVTAQDLERLREELRAPLSKVIAAFCTAHDEDDVPPEATLLVVLADELALLTACLAIPVEAVFDQMQEAHEKHTAALAAKVAAGPEVSL